MTYVLISVIIVVALILYLWSEIKLIIKEYIHVNKNKSYIELITYFCELTYDIIYKSQILAYSASGFKMTKEQLETTQRNFIKLLLELIGHDMESYFLNFFGSSKSFYTYCSVWFQSKLDEDIILKYSTQTKTDGADTSLNNIFRESGK